MDNVEVVTIEGHGFLDGVLAVELEPDGRYHIQMNAGVDAASMRVTVDELTELVTSLQMELAGRRIADEMVPRSEP